MTDLGPDELMEEIAWLRQSGEAFALATIVRTQDATSAKAGAKVVVREDGRLVGWIGGGCVQSAVRRAAKEALEDGQPHLIRVRPKDQVVASLDVDGVELYKSGCPSGGTVEIFVEAMLPRPQLVVLGASPVADAVAELGRNMGFGVVAMDGSPKEDDPDRRESHFDLDDLRRPEKSYLVVATQGRRDREALAAALASDVPYVAFVGSRKKAALLVGQLERQGLKKGRLNRLKAPAGLDIGAIGPDEIALSILAEIIQRRRKSDRAKAESTAEPEQQSPSRAARKT